MYSLFKKLSLLNVKASVIVICLIASILFHSGCVSRHAVYYSSRPLVDSIVVNGIVMFYEPEYEKKINAIGVLSIVGSAFAGGYIGAKNPFVENDNGEPSAFLTAVDCGLAFGGIAMLGVAMASKREPVNSYNVKDWLDMLNEQAWSKFSVDSYQYNYLSHNTSSDGTVESIQAISTKFEEKNFRIRRIGDADLYLALFPKKEHSAEVLNNSLSKISRDDLPKIIYIFGEGAETFNAKLYYLKSATSFKDVMAAYARYPELETQAEALAAQTAQSDSDYEKYLSAFPNGANRDIIKNKLNRIDK